MLFGVDFFSDTLTPFVRLTLPRYYTPYERHWRTYNGCYFAAAAASIFAALSLPLRHDATAVILH